MPPKKKVQVKSKEEDDHSEDEEKTTKAKGRGKSKDTSKDDDKPETRRSGRIAKAQADPPKGGKKKASNSPDNGAKKAGKKVKGGKKKDIEPEDDEDDEEDEEDEEEDEEEDKGKGKGKGSKKEDAKMVKAVTKGGVAVDNYCDLKSSAHVYIDSSANKVYSATLNQSNLKKNSNKSDTNKCKPTFFLFHAYEDQLAKYWVFNRWGRVGYEGQQSTKGPFNSLQPAIAEYESKVYEKTQKGDYIKLDIVYDDDGDAKDDDDKPPAKDNSPAKSKSPAKAKPKGRAAKKKSKDDIDDEEDEEDDDKEEEKDDKKDKKKDDEKEPAKIIKAVTKGGVAVDALCRMKDKVHVYNGPPGNKIYAATLNQSDLKHNNNKFYIVQLLQSDTNKDQFWVFNRWGRVGVDGQQATKGPFSNVQSAVSEYESKVYDKTKKGDYVELAIAYDNDDVAEEANERLTQDSGSSKLVPQVKDLVQLIFDLKQMNNAMKEIGYDAKKCPLGKLAKITIKAGYAVLEKISNALQDKKGKSTLEDLSSEFYSLIPHDIGFKKMAAFVIDDEKKVKAKLEMLQSLEEMQIATKILEEAKDSGNLLDSHYAKLKCELKHLPKDSKNFKLLCDYVKNGHASTHTTWKLEVVEIFEVDKEDDRNRFKKDIGNRMLLWHGSRLTNFVGILSQGLRIAPPEAPVTGYMFGKGVYFADMVSKSAQYCFTSRENNTGLMLLCEVALGETNDLYHSDYYADTRLIGTTKKSTKGCGRTAPHKDSFVTMDDGVIIPIGEGKPTNIPQGSLLYNEFIVYDIAQIRLRYLLRIKFNYA